jgi:predicted small metal-binding protein
MSQEQEIAEIIASHLMGKHKMIKALELAKKILDHLNKTTPNPNS